VLLLAGMQPLPLAALRDTSDTRPSPPASRPYLDISAAVGRDTLWNVALDVGAGSGAPENLAIAWEDLVYGRLRLHSESTGRARSHVIAQIVEGAADSPPCLDASEAALLARLLCGDPQ